MSKDFEISSFYHFCLFFRHSFYAGGDRLERKKWVNIL
jgi:hypothetical protein